MGHLLRGIGARLPQAAMLVVLVAVITAGCQAVVVLCELTGTPVAAAGPLLVLGVVAVAIQAGGEARSRRHEIALAQIRGRSGWRLHVYYLSEPMLLVAVGAGLGVFAGRVVATRAAHDWLGDDGAVDVSRVGWSAVGVSVIAVLASIVVGSWQTVHRPLIEQLDTSHRPRPSGTPALFGQIVVLVGATIAAYQAARGGPGRDDWRGLGSPALLAPVLIGLATVQVGAWFVGWLAVLASRHRATSSAIGRFLAVRRLARRSDTVVGTRLVVAAAVVSAVTFTASSSVTDWRDESTRLQFGGPLRYDVEAGSLTAYELSQQLDPEGHWLMAAVAAPDESTTYRRSFADMARWERVVGSFYAGTSAGSLGGYADVLRRGDPVTLATGSDLVVSFRTRSLRGTHDVSVSARYVNEVGEAAQIVAQVPDEARARGATTTETVRTPGCDSGCVLNDITVDASRLADGSRAVVISRLAFAGLDVLAGERWTTDPRSYLKARHVDGGLSVDTKPGASTDVAQLVADTADQPLVVVVTEHFTPGTEGARTVGYSVDGQAHRTDIVGTVEAIPFIGRQGTLIDLPRALNWAGTSAVVTESMILGRSDTPAAVLHDLEATGQVSKQLTFSDAMTRSTATEAQVVRLYGLMSAFAALIALLCLLTSVRAQRADRRQEAACLRVAGVGTRSISNAQGVEAFILAALAFVAVVFAGWLASTVSLGSLALVPSSEFLPVLRADARPTEFLVVAAAAAVLVGGVTYVAFSAVARSSPPSMLRAEDGR